MIAGPMIKDLAAFAQLVDLQRNGSRFGGLNLVTGKFSPVS
jgi:hypothetical protein